MKVLGTNRDRYTSVMRVLTQLTAHPKYRVLIFYGHDKTIQTHYPGYYWTTDIPSVKKDIIYTMLGIPLQTFHHSGKYISCNMLGHN